MTRVRPARRGGFTLVELLVAIALAILLLSLVVGVTSSGTLGSYRTVRSADRVSGWLLIAKARAIRDGQPRGVRFFKTGAFYTEAQYIEVPPPWVPNPLQEANPTGPRIVFSYNRNTATPPAVIERRCFFVSDTAADLTTFDGRAIQAGDVLTLPGIGAAYQLTAAPVARAAGAAGVSFGAGGLACRELTLADWPDLGSATSDAAATVAALPTPRKATVTTYQFGFTARARPLFGEPLLQLSVDTAIEADAAFTTGVDTAPATFDIVFAPSGQVVGANSLIVLWVRDPTRPAWPLAGAGEQVLIGVYPRTGLIATHPPAPDPVPGKYQYVKDGLSSGL